MIRFTAEAQACLDDYLTDVRGALAGYSSVNPDEIEQDVRDHVSAALEGAPNPVPAVQMAAVLERLGPPSQWVGDSPRSIWKYLGDRLKPVGHKAVQHIKALPGEAYGAGVGLANRVRGLSHDWRLAYIAFGLFALGLIAFPLFPAFLLASYFVARADVSLARERGEALGPKRWLVYPPMIMVSLVLFIALAVWPIAVGVGLSHQIPRSLKGEIAETLEVTRNAVQPVAAVYLAVGAVSLWWMIVSLFAVRFPRLPALLFPPFGASIRRIDALIVFLLSATVFVVWLSRADVAWEVARTVMWKS